MNDGALQVTQKFTLDVGNTNRAPIITTEPVLNAIENKTYRYDLFANDPDAQMLTYALNIAPKGMTIDAKKGTIQWTPGFEQAGQVFVAVSVTDPENAIDQQQFSLQVSNTNQPPIFVSSPTLSGEENYRWQYPVIGADLDTDSLQLSLIEGPKGMALDKDNNLYWKPGFEEEGSYSVTLSFSDSEISVQQQFILIISNTNRPPVVQSKPVRSAKENVPYQYSVVATDADVDTLTYRVALGPKGLQIDKHTGVISWEPTYDQSGIHPVDIVVEDKKQAQTEQRFSINVANTNQPPVIRSKPIILVIAGQPYQYELKFLDPDFNRLAFRLMDAPEGMVFNDQRSIIYWHPNNASIGSHNVHLTATDGEFVVEQRFKLMVEAEEMLGLAL